jgi:6-phosphogluconolactonase (cycloisomerase 2 family)
MRDETNDGHQASERSPSATKALARILTVVLGSALLGSALPASAQIVPGGSIVEGKTIGDWGFEWWQWIYGITSPDPWADTTGSIQNVGQIPPVFFTCGATDAAGGSPITRRFTVPADQYILAALSTGGVYYEPGIDPANICTEVIGAEIDQTSSMFFSLDGVPIPENDLFDNHRETSTLNQTSVIVPGHPYLPPGAYPGSCADGYYVMIEPLPFGPHVIECGFTHPNSAYLDHTNEIYVLKKPVVSFDSVVGGLGGDVPVAPASIELSPDGAHAYVTGGINNELVVFSRDAVTGNLTFVERHQDGVGGVDGLEAALWAETSPDGAHLYVTGRLDNAIAVFARDAITGALTFVEVVRDGVDGVDGLETTLVVQVSPDGKNVYATGQTDNAIAVFARDGVTGELAFVEVVRDGVGGVDGIEGPIAAIVSRDGAHVYATGRGESALAVFTRDAVSGALSQVEVLRDGVGGVDGLDGVGGAVTSPDDAFLYVTAKVDNTIAVFSRNALSGALTFVEVQRDGVGGVDGLGEAEGMSLSASGSHVFATSALESAVSVFERDSATGALTFVDFHEQGIAGVDGLGGIYRIVASPDGRHVYGTGFDPMAFNEPKIAVAEPSTGILMLGGGVFVAFLCRRRVGNR